jgi:hypothetical protein
MVRMRFPSKPARRGDANTPSECLSFRAQESIICPDEFSVNAVLSAWLPAIAAPSQRGCQALQKWD